MSLVDQLMTWTKLELAKSLKDQAKENAELKRRVVELEVEIFWMKVKERDDEQH